MSQFLQSGGDFDKSFKVVSDAQTCTAQKLANLLKLFRGEWFADVTIGTPWYQYFLGVKNPDLNVLKQILNKVLLSAPDVVSVDSLELSLDRVTRLFSVSFSVTTTDGTSLTTSVPFVIQPGASVSQ